MINEWGCYLNFICLNATESVLCYRDFLQMKKIDFSIYRVKFVKSPQLSLELVKDDERNYFISALDDLMSGNIIQKSDRPFRWRVGNLKIYDNDLGYFAFGRTSKSKKEIFNYDSNEFLEEEQDESPHTHCLFNAKLGVLGIAKKYSLASNTNIIAKKLQKVLSKAFSIVEGHITVEILPIPDPKSFVEMIREAYRVLKFTATFGKPNPFDSDRYFQQPLAKLLAASHGEGGSATVEGDDLDREVVTEITKSSAATGNQVSAKIQKISKDSPQTIKLKGQPLTKSFSAHENPREMIQKLTSTYMSIRYDGHS